MPDEMITFNAACKYLGVPASKMRLMVRESAIRAWTLPMQRTWLFRRSDLERIKERMEKYSG